MSDDILIIEDDPRIGRYLETLLEIQGYVTHLVPDGTDALRWLEGNEPSLVICDLGLPHMGGHQLIKQLNISGMRGYPIVVLTAETSRGAARKSFDLEVEHHVTKPIEARTLLALVHHLVHRRGEVAGAA